MKFLLQILVLALSFVLVFLWENSPFSDFTIQTLAVLVIIYLVVSARKRGKGFLTLGGEGPWGIFILNSIILLLIFSTGSINSTLFFLLYFLGFGIAFVFSRYYQKTGFLESMSLFRSSEPLRVLPHT